MYTHSSTQLISYVFTVMTIHCDRLRLEQFSPGHSHEKDGTYLVILFDICSVIEMDENDDDDDQFKFLFVPPTSISFLTAHLSSSCYRMFSKHSSAFQYKTRGLNYWQQFFIYRLALIFFSFISTIHFAASKFTNGCREKKSFSINKKLVWVRKIENSILLRFIFCLMLF